MVTSLFFYLTGKLPAIATFPAPFLSVVKIDCTERNPISQSVSHTHKLRRHDFHSILSLIFQLVSATHGFECRLMSAYVWPTPIVARLRIIRLIIDGALHIRSRDPPAVVLVIPDRLSSRSLKHLIEFLIIIMAFRFIKG